MQGSIIFEISRRTFVKWSAAVATLAALPLSKGLFASSPAASPAMTTLAAGSPPAREPLKGVWKPSACWQNCGGSCRNKVFIVGNSIIRQKPDDSHHATPVYPQPTGFLPGRFPRRHVLGPDLLYRTIFV